MGSYIPRLLHPVLVTFQLQDKSNTVYDKYAREPVQQVTRQGESPRTGTALSIKGQVSFYFASAKLNDAAFGFEREGIVEGSIGYVALRFKDMVRVGLATYDAVDDKYEMVLQRGDRIAKFARREVDFYVTGFKDFAHYTAYGQTLIQVNFSDRHPGYLQVEPLGG